MKRGDVYWADLTPRSGVRADGAAAGDSGLQ